jgi:hypothetical protein
MARCAACGTTILFGGQRAGDQRYCNATCLATGQALAVARQLPEAEVQSFVQRLHVGPCPKCRGNGPVEVYRVHKVWSALIITSWSSVRQVSCRSCASKAQLGGIAFSLLLGWWGFPWGLILTPVQVVRNLRGLLRTPDPYRPSPELETVARVQLVSQLAAAR